MSRMLQQIQNKSNLQISSRLLNEYLSLIYKSIKFNNFGVNKVSFSHYLRFPIFICDKIFSLFSIQNKEYLSQEEFIKALMSIYSSSLSQFEEFLFSVLNINYTFYRIVPTFCIIYRFFYNI